MLGGDGGNAPDVIGAEAFRPDNGEMPLKPPINLPKLPETRRKFAIFLLWMERATGIEPVQPAWEAGRLPLHHARRFNNS